MKIEGLKRIGISEGFIDFYIKNNEIIVRDGTLKFSNNLLIRLFLEGLKNGKNNYSLFQSLTDDNFIRIYMQLLSSLYLGDVDDAKIYLSIINSKYSDNEYKDIIALYNCLLNGININNLRIIYDDNAYIGFKINLVKKYLCMHQYVIAADLLEDILNIDDNIYLQILRNVCTQLPTKTLYIVDEAKIKDRATKEGIARMERRMLIDLELGESLISSENFNNLVRFGVGQEIYEIIVSFLNWIDYFKVNYRKISNRDLRAVYGDLDSVVANLLLSQDFYRLKRVIDEAYATNENFSLKLQVYKILVDCLMYYNKRNREFIDRERLISLNKDNEKILIERYPVSSISVDSIDAMDCDMQVDFSKNYYQIYERYYKLMKYREAKRALQQFKVNMLSIDVTTNFDYLFKELDVLIANEKDSEENKNKIVNLLNKAKEVEMTDSDMAITFYLDALKYQSTKNPLILSKVAEIYNKRCEYDKALSYYKEADKSFIYPSDYITIMELLIKTKKYREVPIYARKYDSYYPEENAYAYYLLSIAYANDGLYDLAEDALNTADAINTVCYNTPIHYIREHNILECLSNNESVDLYTIDDFVNYDLNAQEKELLGYVDNLKNHDTKSYLNTLKRDALSKATIEEKVSYLLMLIKIFNYKEDEKKVSDLINFVEDILNKESVPNDIKEETSKKLSIYKTD